MLNEHTRFGAGQPGGRGAFLPRVASVQNAYSLTCRTFDAGLAECCHEEGVSLLAYSPLAMGLLTVSSRAGQGGRSSCQHRGTPGGKFDG
jgi:aryl-alcohol dehydrogenase-like predicted oxidoreductase